jgi:uracil phosphoribosyltransferase
LINTRHRAATAVRCTQCPDQLPQSAGRPVFVLDPMLATSFTVNTPRELVDSIDAAIR